MTVIEAIERTDALLPNTLSEREKLIRLCAIDRELWEEIILPRRAAESEGAEGTGDTGGTGDSGGASVPATAIPQDGENTPDPSSELIVPPPYDELYIHALSALIHYSYGEIARYNNSLACYDELKSAFIRRYNRDHRRPRGTFSFF